MYVTRYTDRYLPASNTWKTIKTEESFVDSPMNTVIDTMVRNMMRKEAVFDIHVSSKGDFGFVSARSKDTKYELRTRFVIKTTRDVYPDVGKQSTYIPITITPVGL